MLNPYYHGAGLEVLSDNFDDMYKVLVLNHEVYQSWCNAQSEQGVWIV